MKKIALLAAVPLLVAACTGAPAATVTVTESAAPPKSAEPREETRPRLDIMDLLVDSDPAFGALSRSDVVEVAKMVCENLDQGYAASTLGNLAMESGFTKDQAASLIAASIVVYCPWQRDNVR